MASVLCQFVALSLVLHSVLASRVDLEPDQELADARQDWTRKELASPDERTSLVFALRQLNAAELERKLMAVSTPGSPDYGRFLSAEQVRELVRPSEHTVRVVQDWLLTVGISVDGSCTFTAAQEFLDCDVTAAQATALLDVPFYRYSRDDMVALRAAGPYTVPASLEQHLDFVGGVHRLARAQHVKKNDTKLQVATGHGISQIAAAVTPATIRDLYNIGDAVGAGADDKNIQCVAQFLDQHYKPSDLKEFMEKHATGFTHLSEVAKLIGPNEGLRAGIEASLDIEYIMAVGSNIPTWFWSTGGKHEGQEPFLLWIEAVANSTTIPNVISVSYGDDEDTLSTVYMQRISQEFQKLGVRGVSILFASGDDGAGCHKQVFRPNFPASSPYITAVGGTIQSAEERAETGVSFSSGGFSNVFAQAAFQSTDVKHFLATSTQLPDEQYFNKSGRGYPDVSALSVGFEVIANGFTQAPSGTSCAAPTFAGVVSLVNDMLINQHSKTALGFLNPFLYSGGTGGLKDVTHGCNEGCSGKGFCAQAGWDPVTGVGTPSFEKLLAEALKAKGVY